MFDDFKVTNYPKSLVSPELYGRHLSRLYTGDVIDGFTLTPGTGLKVVLAPGNAMVRYGSGAVASARFVSLVNNFELTVGTPDASNPRIDVVVLYVDTSVNLPSGTPSVANLDGPGVAKAKIVAGTPAANPSAPNDTAIQSSVGASNPYTVLHQVRVESGVSVIASDKIMEVREMAKLTADKIDSVTYQFTLLNRGLSTSRVTIGTATIPSGEIGSGTYEALVTGAININFGGGGSTVGDALIGVYLNGVRVGNELYLSKAAVSTYNDTCPVSTPLEIDGSQANTITIEANLSTSSLNSVNSYSADRSQATLVITGRA